MSNIPNHQPRSKPPAKARCTPNHHKHTTHAYRGGASRNKHQQHLPGRGYQMGLACFSAPRLRARTVHLRTLTLVFMLCNVAGVSGCGLVGRKQVELVNRVTEGEGVALRATSRLTSLPTSLSTPLSRTHPYMPCHALCRAYTPTHATHTLSCHSCIHTHSHSSPQEEQDIDTDSKVALA